MSHGPKSDIENFCFHRLHPKVKIGTASDRYAGWVGQIYSEERYRGRIGQRTKVLGELYMAVEKCGGWRSNSAAPPE